MLNQVSGVAFHIGGRDGMMHYIYSLVNIEKALENGPVEIVDLPWFTQLQNSDVP